MSSAANASPAVSKVSPALWVGPMVAGVIPAAPTKVILSITGGVASTGAGIVINSAATLAINMSTLAGNYATASGGGIYNAGTMVIEGSTISGNFTGHGGEGGTGAQGTGEVEERGPGRGSGLPLRRGARPGRGSPAPA